MSLINQMLQDLERRSSGLPSGTQFEPAKSKSLGTDQEKPKTHAFLKVTSTLVLLYCAVFIWVKNPEIFRLFNQQKPAETPVAHTTPQVTAAPPAQPAPVAAPPIAAEEKSPAPENIASAEPAPTSPVEINEKVTNETETLNEPVKKPAKKVARTKPKADLAALSDDSMPMAVAVVPQATDITKKVESSLAEFKKSKLRQPNGQPENGFTKIESAEQKSNNLFNRALNAIEQGRVYEAQAYLAKSIQENPGNEEARQTLAVLLIDGKKIGDAQTLLMDGLKLNPKNNQFRMTIARMQLDAGDKKLALNTMTEGLSDGRHDAAYQSLLANLLQRDGRHDEAAAHFNAAIQLRSGYPNDYIGLGISLQALEKLDEARNAYTSAITSEKISPELRAFAEQQLSLIKQRIAAL